jgi:hypothetical protein
MVVKDELGDVHRAPWLLHSLWLSVADGLWLVVWPMHEPTVWQAYIGRAALDRDVREPGLALSGPVGPV